MEKNQDYFVNKAFKRFFLPSLLSSLWLALGGIADCFFVGNQIGEAGLAAISFGTPLFMVYNTISYGIALGGSIHYSKLLGEGKAEEGAKIFSQSVCFVLSLWIAFAVVGNIFIDPLIRFLGAKPEDPEVYRLTREYVSAQLISCIFMYYQGCFYYFVHNDDAPQLRLLPIVRCYPQQI